MDFSQLVFRECTPPSDGNIEVHVHDPYSLQPGHSIIEGLTHPSDLTVQSLREDNLE
jgi:hypothetical protein